MIVRTQNLLLTFVVHVLESCGRGGEAFLAFFRRKREGRTNFGPNCAASINQLALQTIETYGKYYTSLPPCVAPNPEQC